MITRKLIFTFQDGHIIERDLMPVVKDAPLGAGANNEFYENLALQSMTMGIIDTDTKSKTYLKVYSPCFVKHIEIIFTDTNKQAEA